MILFWQGKTEGFFEYYKPEVLSAGLQSGKLVSGRISVNKHLAMTEAFVSRGAVKDSDKVGHIRLAALSRASCSLA